MEETVQVSLFSNKSQATQCLGKQSSMFFIPSFPLLLGSQHRSRQESVGGISSLAFGFWPPSPTPHLLVLFPTWQLVQ